MSVYFDFNATTPLAPSVIAKITDSLAKDWGNPSSGHEYGVKAKASIAEARGYVASMIGCENTNDIVFTSGGTESNNMVIFSVKEYFKDWLKQDDGLDKPHVITSNVEHDAVILPLRHLEKHGDISLSVVPVNSNGCINTADVLAQIIPATCLVTLMHANNETGVIMPIEGIGRHLVEVNRSRHSNGLPKVFLHTDAAQSVGKIFVNVGQLNVDYLTIVGHKFYGPRVGALYVRGLSERATPLYPMLFGGGQEAGLRPGTLNTPMIVGLGEAANLVSQHLGEYMAHMTDIRDHLEESLKTAFADRATVNCRQSPRLPNTCSVALPAPGPALLSRCPRLLASVAASCHAQVKPSAILIRSGVSPTSAANTIRLSVGRDSTRDDVRVVVDNLKAAAEKCLINENSHGGDN